MRLGKISGYEETGVSGRTLVLRRVVYGVLLLYPFYDSLKDLLVVNDLLSKVIGASGIALAVTAIYRLSPMMSVAVIILGSIARYTLQGLFPLANVILYALLALTAEYIAGLVSLERITISRKYSLTSVVLTLILPISIISTSVAVAILTYKFVAELYRYFVENTIVAFQLFYEIFSSTRIGLLVLTALSIFTVYYVLDRYVYGVLSDTVLLSKPLARSRVSEYVKVKWSAVLELKETFTAVFLRSFLFITLFYTYTLLSPLLTQIADIFPIQASPIITFIWKTVLWMAASTVIYVVVKKRLEHALLPVKLRRPNPSYKALYTSLLLMFLYLSVLLITSPHDWQKAIYRALLPVKADHTYQDAFTSTILHYFMYCDLYCEWYIRWYFNEIAKAYNELADILNELLKFLWG